MKHPHTHEPLDFATVAKRESNTPPPIMMITIKPNTAAINIFLSFSGAVGNRTYRKMVDMFLPFSSAVGNHAYRKMVNIFLSFSSAVANRAYRKMVDARAQPQTAPTEKLPII